MYTIKKETSATARQREQEIEGLMHALSETYDRYRKHIFIAVTAVLAVLAAVGGYALYQARNDGKASAMLAGAYEYYRTGPSGQPEYQKALELFRQIRSGYSGTLSAAVAQYYAGNCLMGMGRTQDAVAEYQYFVKHYGDEKELLGLVYQRMGYAYGALGNREESRKSFERADLILGPGLAALELANLYAQEGKTEEARKEYEMIAQKLPGTALAEAAKQRIAAGAGSGKAGK